MPMSDCCYFSPRHLCTVKTFSDNRQPTVRANNMTAIREKFRNILRIISMNATAAAGWCRLPENGTSEPSSSDWRSVSPMTCTSCKDYLDEDDIAFIRSWRARVHEGSPEMDSGSFAPDTVEWRDVLDSGPQVMSPGRFSSNFVQSGPISSSRRFWSRPASISYSSSYTLAHPEIYPIHIHLFCYLFPVVAIPLADPSHPFVPDIILPLNSHAKACSGYLYIIATRFYRRNLASRCQCSVGIPYVTFVVYSYLFVLCFHSSVTKPSSFLSCTLSLCTPLFLVILSLSSTFFRILAAGLNVSNESWSME
ncbi:hypothetical protein HGRIS_012385 [Hohenbuehelia grisea]|uniref:Uncharacterized protein n=1 Tax=Hohenbuehelia grisea TaxID=104357 RepID=A0ABR3IS35_9AGAR